MSLKVYLAATLACQDECALKARMLEKLGIKVVSTWLAEIKPLPIGDAKSAKRNCEELKACDIFICLTRVPSPSGGMHVEFGMAVAEGKRIFICGRKMNVFHNLPNISIYSDWSSLVDGLIAIRDSKQNATEQSH